MTTVITTSPDRLKACIAEALRVAEVLRRDVILCPPGDDEALDRAWGRVLAHWDEAQRWTEAYLRAWAIAADTAKDPLSTPPEACRSRQADAS